MIVNLKYVNKKSLNNGTSEENINELYLHTFQKIRTLNCT